MSTRYEDGWEMGNKKGYLCRGYWICLLSVSRRRYTCVLLGSKCKEHQSLLLLYKSYTVNFLLLKILSCFIIGERGINTNFPIRNESTMSSPALTKRG